MADVPGLFAQVDAALSDDPPDNVAALAAVRKILAADANDADALHVQVVVLAQMSRYKEALAVFQQHPDLAKNLAFVHAYCLYGVQQLDEALDVCASAGGNSSADLLLLQAQAYYRRQNYTGAVKAYQQVSKQFSGALDDFQSLQMSTNLAAAALFANDRNSVAHVISDVQTMKEMYELAYNAACFEIAEGNLERADELLALARATCESSDLDSDELAEELVALDVQKAYLLQRRGEDAEAGKIYASVLERSGNEAGVAAVACNNMVALNREHDLYKSDKLSKRATDDAVLGKLSPPQWFDFHFNRALLLMYMNKGEACRDVLKAMRERDDSSPLPVMVQAAMLMREKKFAKCEDALRSFASASPQAAEPVLLTLAQVNRIQGNVAGCAASLTALPSLKHRPGVVATLVALYEKQDAVDSAAEVLRGAASALAASASSAKEKALLARYRSDLAALLMRHGQFRDAAAILRDIVDQDSRNMRAVANLIICYSRYDPAEAEQFSQRLPSLPASEVDVEALLAASAPRSRFGKVTKVKKDEPEAEIVQGQALRKKKKKKKRKRPLPKDYNPDRAPDPDRWLPKWQRASFKKSRRHRNKELGRGAQGAGTLSKEAAEATTSAPAAAAASTAATRKIPMKQAKRKKKGRR